MTNNGKPWSNNDHNEVIRLLNIGSPLNVITSTFERTNESILWKAIKDIEDKTYIPNSYHPDIYASLETIPYYRKLAKVFELEPEEAEDEEPEEEAEDDEAEENEEAEDDDDEAEAEDDETDNNKYIALAYQLEKLSKIITKMSDNKITINITIHTIGTVSINNSNGSNNQI